MPLVNQNHILPLILLLCITISYVPQLISSSKNVLATKTFLDTTNFVRLLNRYDISYNDFQELVKDNDIWMNMATNIPIAAEYNTLNWEVANKKLVEKLHDEFFKRDKVKFLLTMMTMEQNKLAEVIAKEMVEQIEESFTKDRSLYQQLIKAKQTNSFTYFTNIGTKNYDRQSVEYMEIAVEGTIGADDNWIQNDKISIDVRINIRTQTLHIGMIAMKSTLPKKIDPALLMEEFQWAAGIEHKADNRDNYLSTKQLHAHSEL